MKTTEYLFIAVCCVLIHGAISVLWHPYGDLVLSAGAGLVPNSDLASLPERMMAGLALTLPIPLIAAFLLGRLVQLWQ